MRKEAIIITQTFKKDVLYHCNQRKKSYLPLTIARDRLENQHAPKRTDQRIRKHQDKTIEATTTERVVTGQI
jgi:hypothetical protein